MSISQEAAALREHWLAYLIEGILLVVLGAAAMVVPSWATLTVKIFLGWLFLLSGLVGLITTFWLKRAPGFWWSLLSAVLAVVVGVLLIGWPVSGAMSLTLALLIYFVAEGVFSIMFGLAHQRSVGPLGLAGAQWHHRPVLSRSNPLWASRYCGLGTGAAGRHRSGLWWVGADRSVEEQICLSSS